MSSNWRHNAVGLEDEKQREAHTRGKPLNLSPGLASDTLRHDANRQRQGQIEMNVPLRIGNSNARFSQLPIIVWRSSL